MASIERTAYPVLPITPDAVELRSRYTPNNVGSRELPACIRKVNPLVPISSSTDQVGAPIAVLVSDEEGRASMCAPDCVEKEVCACVEIVSFVVHPDAGGVFADQTCSTVSVDVADKQLRTSMAAPVQTVVKPPFLQSRCPG